MASTTTTAAATETAIQCPRCGSVQHGRADAATICRGCGARLKPPAAPANVLSYARPADPVGVACWRHGTGRDARIVIPDGGSTPDRCVRCNAPARGYLKRVKAHEPIKSDCGGGFGPDAGAAAISAGIIASVDLAFGLAARESGVVHLAVCPACRRKADIAWRGAMPLAFVALGTVLAGSMSFADGRPHALAWGLAGTILGAALLVVAIWWAVAWSLLLPLDRIVGRELWFKPNGRAFLESLPECTTDVTAPPAPSRSSPAA